MRSAGSFPFVATNNPLRKAILDGNAALVEELCIARQELAFDASDSGLGTLDLALAKQDPSIVMSLVRAGCTSVAWSPSADLLVDYMHFFSSWWAAGWLQGIEFECYSLVLGKPPSPFWSDEVMNGPTEQQVSDLRQLLDEYAVWPTAESGLVPVEDWSTLYGAWLKVTGRPYGT